MIKNPYVFSTFDPSFPIILVDYLSNLYNMNKTKKILIATDYTFTTIDKNTDVFSLDDKIINNYKTIIVISDIFKKTYDFVINFIKFIKKNNNLILIYNLNDKSMDIKFIIDFINTINNKFDKFIIKKNKCCNHILLKFIKFGSTNNNIIKNKFINYITKSIDSKKKINDMSSLKYIIKIGNKYNYAINNYYEDLINNFTLRLKQDVYSSSNSNFIFFNGQLKLNGLDFGVENGCNVENFGNIYDKFIKKKTLRNLCLIQKNKDTENLFLKLKINRKHLPRYLHKNFFYKYTQKPFNNAFLKLFEILSEIKLFNKKNEYVTLHLAELPGGFIYATNAIINNISNNAKHIWYGNSYNPKIISQGFDDNYGLVKKYPNRWLWGEDGTGDLTKIENIENIKKNIKESHVDLITLDGGLSADNELVTIQKLDYAQMLVVAMLSTKGTNCVVKTFGNYLFSYPKSIDSIGLYSDILLIYSAMFENIYLIKPPNSSSNSMEFYIVGINFIPLNVELLEELKQYMAKFEANKCFLLKKQREKIKEILTNMYKFYNMIIELGNEELNKQIFLFSCLNIDTNSPFYNKKFIDESYSFLENNDILYKIGIQKAKIWCKIYNVDENIKITI